MKELKETHQRGLVSVENLPEQRYLEGDLGVQIARDGRIWICIDGIAFLRFRPGRTELSTTTSSGESDSEDKRPH